MFRFATLLRVQQMREDEQKRVVAARLGRIGAIEGMRRKLIDQVDEELGQMRDGLAAPLLDVEQARLSRGWLGGLRWKVHEAEGQLVYQRAMLAQEQAELTTRRQATRVIERLREKWDEKNRAEDARREAREMDDIGVTRYVHHRLRRKGDGR